MLSILNLKSSVTHRVVFYATLIAPIGGAICYFCFFGKFCFLPKSRLLLLFAVFAFAFRARKKSRPFGFLRILRFLLLPFAPSKKNWIGSIPNEILLPLPSLISLIWCLIKWRTNFIASVCRLWFYSNRYFSTYTNMNTYLTFFLIFSVYLHFHRWQSVSCDCSGFISAQYISLLVVSMEKWSASSEVYVEDVFMSFRKYCRGIVNMSY